MTTPIQRKISDKSDRSANAAHSNNTSHGKAKDGKEPNLLADQPKKWEGWNKRFWTTWAMLGGFTVIIYLGHIALIGLVVTLQTWMFKEVYSHGSVWSRDKALPYFKHLPWLWYLNALFFTYGRLLINEFDVHIPGHLFISFTIHATGFVWFVLSLDQKHYKYQFGLFAWVQLTLLLIVVQSSFLVVNMFSGLIWFILPCLLIISNDIWAYFFGFFWGRTPLIQLSPKKTWEGFLGGFLMTVLTGFFLSRFLSLFQIMVCPQYELAWFARPTCEPSLPFRPVTYPLPELVVKVLATAGVNWATVDILPIQFHGIALAVFASLVAPFGGFFASGFKRAFKLKDFGDVIPGHGGVTDRMDCQIMMGLFVFVYHSTFVREYMDISFVYNAFIKLTRDDQLALFEQLRNHLVNTKILA